MSQSGDHLTGSGLDFEGGEVVGSGRPDIHYEQGLVLEMDVIGEPVAGHDTQRRAEDQQAVAVIQLEEGEKKPRLPTLL